MANRVDPDQTAPWGAVWPGSVLFAYAMLPKKLTLKKLITTVADKILIFFFVCVFFQKKNNNKTWHFMCLADDSHEIPSLIFSEKYLKKEQNVVCYNFA